MTNEESNSKKAIARKIAHRLYLNRQERGVSGSAEEDWAKADRIVKNPVRRTLFHLHQPFIWVEKRAVEPVANWLDRADLFRIIERISPAIEALGVIAIPLVLFFQELERLQQQAVTDYLNQLSAILLDINDDLHAPQNERLRTLTTATTLTLLRGDPNLDGARKGQVIGFLSQMNLVQGKEIYGPQHPEDNLNEPLISLNRANLRNASLRSADLSNADLNNADLRNADLNNADLSNADLRFTILSNTDLNNADLNNADLSNADLSNADLGNAFLLSADLRSADLRSADLRFTILLDTDLRSAQGLTQEQLAGDNPPLICNSPLPKGIEIDRNRDCERIAGALQRRYPWFFNTLKEAQEYVNRLGQRKFD
ncbi:MAG: pentapeptide repeat-containing protein [Leptolyngbyaceae cyanobacterium MO_188.B28]|nr:pentapeptide repeat-containing protein [Leptolyngbyaceae cyanobacterium MO_188.B28]